MCAGHTGYKKFHRADPILWDGVPIVLYTMMHCVFNAKLTPHLFSEGCNKKYLYTQS